MNPMLLHLSALLTAACIAGLWQGMLIAGVAVGLCVSMRHASAALRYSVLIASFAAVVILPWLGLFHTGSATAAASHTLRIAPGIGLAVAALWLAAAMLRALQLFLAGRRIRSIRRDAQPLPHVAALTVGSRHVLLCSSAAVDAPMIVGFRSPRLLLPEWMVPGLSATEFHQIALHECEHLRRGDDWINLVLECALALSPLNPALFWLNRTIRLQRELAVDAAVVAQTEKPHAYASCLTRLAEQRSQRRHLRLALSAWGRKPELVQRVHALLDRSSAWSRIQSASAFAGALATLCIATALLGRMPQIVQVGPDAHNPGSRSTLAAAAPITNNFAAASTTRTTLANLATGLPADSLAGLPLVRTAAISTSRPNERINPAHIVTATFRTSLTRNGKPILQRSKLSRTHAPAHALQTLIPASVHMLRTSYDLPSNPSARHGAYPDPDAQVPVEIVPALFYTPYAAVPTSSGWLLIEL